MFGLFKRKPKKPKLEEITFHLETGEFQEEIESLQKFKNPTYELSKKDFIREASEAEKEFEYVFEDKNPSIVNRVDEFVICVSGIPVGTIKKGSMSRYRNLVKDGRIDHIYVALKGGKYKVYTSYINRDNKEVFDYTSSETGYFAELYIYAIPKVN